VLPGPEGWPPADPAALPAAAGGAELALAAGPSWALVPYEAGRWGAAQGGGPEGSLALAGEPPRDDAELLHTVGLEAPGWAMAGSQPAALVSGLALLGPELGGPAWGAQPQVPPPRMPLLRWQRQGPPRAWEERPAAPCANCGLSFAPRFIGDLCGPCYSARDEAVNGGARVAADAAAVALAGRRRLVELLRQEGRLPQVSRLGACVKGCVVGRGHADKSQAAEDEGGIPPCRCSDAPPRLAARRRAAGGLGRVGRGQPNAVLEAVRLS
jgi:hypothetical protein